MKKVLLGAVLAAALLVPTASAGLSHTVKLGVVVLPKSALGSAAHGLKVSPDSGVVSNLAAASNSNSAAGNTFDKLGRLTGYELVYGDRYSGRSGVTEISTGVDKYKTSAAAKHGLAFWLKDGPRITAIDPYGLPFRVKKLKAAKVGTRRFAEGTTLAIPNAVPIALVDEQFTDGRYLLHADVAAASLAAAAHLAGKLAKTLDHRLRLAEAGRLHGKPVKVPPPQRNAGPPAGGPDLATLALTSADFAGQATVTDEGYSPPGPPSLSEFARDMEPAGSFDDLTQVIDWFPTANDATVLSRFEGVAFAYLFGSGVLIGVPGQFTSVDVSAVGHNAYGATVSVTQTGEPTVYLGIVSLSSGQAADFVLVGSHSPIQSADLVSFAQTVANRLDAGLAG